MEEKECYIFRCEKYPHCKKAKGKCCAIDFDAEGRMYKGKRISSV